MPIGRPSKYDPAVHIPALEDAVKFGATWPQIAKVCGVADSTVREWYEKHGEFRAAVKDAKARGDEAVEDALKEAAAGGRNINVTAAIFWLCNRAPDRWKHVQRIEHTGVDGGPITHADISDEGRLIAEAEAIAKRAATAG